VRYFSNLFALIVLSFAAVSVTWSDHATAATAELTWADNSSNESGFRIERKIGTTGTFAALATTGANVTSYNDSNLANSATYCYRVAAFNDSGTSPYSSEICGTTSAPPPPASQQYTLTVAIVKSVTSAGTGNGTVTSSPAGINCGTTCSAPFKSGTSVSLTATPAAGSTFAGWSGTGCSTGVVTMDMAKTCTATFTSQAAQTYLLSVTKSGSGSGTVTSSPAGINCGTTCSASFKSGTSVSLTARPAAGSTFAGWTGNGCTGGKVTMSANSNCTATFQSGNIQVKAKIGVFRPDMGQWFLDLTGNGKWENCQRDRCVERFGTAGDMPVAGDWDGSGIVKIGVFRPSTGEWLLDINGNGQWNDCGQDRCLGRFGTAGDLPVAGDWDGSGSAKIGVFRPSTGEWFLDMNGNGQWDDCGQDRCLERFGMAGDLPVAGDWDGSGSAKVGVFRPSTGEWLLDMNGNGQWNDCGQDRCLERFGMAGDLPVAGDWDGSGSAKIGVFRPSTGEWFLDTNGNGQFNGCTVDACLDRFGKTGDLPVVGKWQP
jgi:hypothetical protein